MSGLILPVDNDVREDVVIREEFENPWAQDKLDKTGHCLLIFCIKIAHGKSSGNKEQSQDS